MRGHSDRSNDRVDEAMGQYAGWNTISYGNIIILNILEEILCDYHEIVFSFLNCGFCAGDPMISQT